MITNAVTLEQGVTVTQLKGQIYLVAADGSRKLLAEGDVLPKGAVIMSPDGASFMGGGQAFNVQPASEQSEPAEEGDAPQLAQNGAAGTPDDINALQQAILGGADPTQAFEASAAGGAPAAGGGGGGIGGVAGSSGNGGFVTIDRTGDATIAEATFDTTYNTNGEPPLGAAGEDEVFDLTPPTISVVAPDNTNDTTPTLTGTTDAPAGSTVTLLVTDANGNQQTLTATVTPGGTFTVDVVTPLAEGSYTVTATVTDPAGNTGSATDDGSVDSKAPELAIELDANITDDDAINVAEAGQQIPISGTVSGEFKAGDTVTLTLNNTAYTGKVDAAGRFTILVAGSDLAADGDKIINASVTSTDAAGNSATATDTENYGIDTTTPEISNTTISYAENQAANAVLGNIGAADDKGVTGIVFKATGTNTSADGYYQINANGDVVLTAAGAAAGVNDFEQGPNSGDYVVVVSDAAGNQTEATITLKETDLDENRPTVGNTTISYAENQAANAVLGNIGAADDKGVTGIVFKATGTNTSADGYYQINANGDVVLTAAGAAAGVNDFEQGPNSGDYVVVVSDAAGNQTEATITLKETDLDENRPTVGNTTISYAENQAANAVLGNIGAADDKGVTGIVFKATGTNTSADGYYQINANGDVVLTAAGAAAGVNDFEQGPNSGDYVVVVSDAAGNQTEATITLKETDLDENRPTVGNTTISYAENQAANAVLGNIGAADDKGVTGIVFKATGTNTSADGYYQINANGDVVLTAAGAAAGVNDFEQGPNSGDYVVVVSDAAGNQTEATITLKETDLDENRPTVGNTTISYAENQAANAVLGNIGAADDKGVTGIVFKATGTNTSADGYYQINANGDVVLTAAGAAAGVNDFEQGPNSGDYVVVVSDAAGNQTEATITLKETDLDENRPTVGNTTISYAENQAANAVLGNIGAADDKGVTGIVFKATGTNTSADGYYQINANGDVVLTAAGAAAGVNDFEQGPNSGDYVVVVSDAAGNQTEATITLKETDLDENRPTVGNTTISYAENQAANAVLGNIGAADDKGVTGIVFKATGTNTSADGYYQINANGDVVLTAAGAAAGVNDFEQGPNSGDYVVVVSDAAGNQTEATITLKETDLDENRPTVGNTTISYAENQAANAVLGNIGAADDKGVTGIVFKATGTNTSADGYYQINANGDVVLTAAGAAAGVNDFEQGPNSGDYVVVVSDAAGNQTEATITLKETDLDENRPTVGNTTISYAENQAANAVLGNIGAADDKGVTGIVFKATGTNTSADGYYQINANGDVVLTAAGAAAGVNDFEQGPNSGDYVVVVSDAAGNQTEATITLKETDLDENRPTVGNTTISYAENQAANAVLGNIGAADDKGVTGIVFKATGTNTSADGYYQINANGDVVLTAAGAAAGVNDFEQGPNSGDYVVVVSDAAGNQTEATITLKETDLDENRPTVGNTTISYAENQAANAVLGNIGAADDKGVTGIVFKATGTNTSADGYYQINANGDVVLTAAGAAAGVNDFEQGPNSGDYVVVVSDAAGNQTEATITLKETDLDENRPTVGNTTISYAENQAANAVLGNIGAADDKGVTGIVFKATGTNTSADGYYQINANGDVVLTAAGAAAGVNDFEQGPNSGDYVVVVSDAAGNQTEATITLKETDLDENRPTVGNTTISYAENQAANAVLGNIGAADDKGVTGIVFKATGTNTSADGYYQINANGDVVLTAAGAAAGVNDFEQGPNSGDYVVVVSDAAGNQTEATITLKETDLDENRPTVGNTTISYAENQAANAVLGNIGAADDKGVTGIVFKATGTNTSADGYYQINANGDVVLTAAGAAAGVNDFEQGPNSGDYVVVVSDAAGNQTEATITLKETDLDENRPTVGNTTISYAENQAANAVLGNIGAADDKGVTGIVFKATGTNTSADGYYQINANGDVVLTAAGAAAGVNDFEQGPNSGDYVVVVSDAAGNQTEATITLKETDLDENRPTVGNTTISYAENQAANAVLGNIGAADDKGVTGIVFKATGTNTSADGYYQINANGDVVLTAAGAAAGVNDFEQGPNSGDYVVVVSDAAGNQTEATITLKETDLDENRPTVGNTTISYAENQAANAVLGNIGAADDKGVTGIVFKATGTNTSADGYYQINANGDVVLTAAGAAAGVNDFEQGPNSGDYVVVVSDAAGNQTEATITLKETDLDENRPTVGNTTISYAENQAANAVLGNIGAADDKGVTGIVFKATGTNTSADGYYQINANGDVVLTAAGAAAGVNDFEQGPNSGDYVVVVSDAAGNQTEATITLKETDLDENRPTVGNTTISYAENQAANAVLGNIGAADDKGVTGIVFKATGTNTSADGYYQINANGDVVLTAAGAAAGVNDFEQGPNSGDYVVVVSDAAGNQTEATITLKETDVNEAPTTSGGYAQGKEDMPLTLEWSDFKASDVDTAADKLSIKITLLPADGVLQYKDVNGNWQSVVKDQVFSKADIDAGRLQFLPDQHEASGSAGSGANTGADGNKLGDYASFGYQVSDGVNNSGNATFVVDVKPVADGVTLKVELVSGGFVPGAVKVEQIVSGLNGKTPSTSSTGGDDYLVTNGSWVLGGGGNDTIKYGSGDHFLAKGEAGNDILIGGGSVTDNLDGGDGNDILIGGKNATSSVTLNAGAGNDTLIAQSLKASTSYYGGDGLDVAYMPSSMKDLKLVTTGLPQGCDYRLVYKDSSGALTNHDFYSVETLYLQDGKYEIKDGTLTKVTDLATLKVDVDLIDSDGSEHFTELTIKGLPQGTLLSGGTLQADGSWKVPASMLDKDGKLSLQVELPVGSQNIKVTVVAGSQEYDMNGQPIADEAKYTEADTGFMIKPTNPNGDNTVEGGRGDDVLLGDIGGIKTSVEPGKNYNIALIVDTSGSMQWGLDGSQYPATGKDRMTLTIAALKVLANQLADHDGVVNVTLIGFHEWASSLLTLSDMSKSNVQSFIDTVSSLSAGGATNYEDAFIKATAWFNSKPGSSSGLTFENVTYFLTDGDPTAYNGDRNASESDAMQKAIDAFGPLSGQSEVKAIGIGNGVTKENLEYFDNTKVVGSGSQYETIQLLNDFSGNTGPLSSKWSNSGDQLGSVVIDSGWLRLMDIDGRGASVFTSETLKIAAGTGLRFDLIKGSDLDRGDTFSVQLQRLDGTTWVDVGTAVNSAGIVDSGSLAEGDYRYVFTISDVDQGRRDDSTATLWIDKLSKVNYPPVGQPDIIETADQLKAVLIGGSTTNIPAEVGADVLHGGAGNDILFGDAINTDHLPWGSAGNPAKPADWVDGKGLDGLTQFLTLKNGYAPSSLELYEYIKGNAKSFDVAGDTRGGNDKLHGGLGDDILFGQGGDDELYGDDGKDILYGGTGSDKLDGGAGNDILSGGLGNDILTGGEGADIFVWSKGDSSASNPATDIITDFNKTANNTVDLNQKDVIDLSDLLDSDGGKSEASLKGLLSIFEESGKVRLEVRDDTSQHNLMQTIVLEGHSFASLTGNTYTDKSQASQVIDYMLLNNMLEIDKPHG